MHLVRGMTGLNTKKNKKRKLTLNKISKFQEQMFAHNKDLRRKGLHDLQMDLQNFIDYCHGDYTPRVSKAAAKPWKAPEPYYRESPDIPSLNSMEGTAFARNPNKYTGTLIKGIATMHKSNAVPIIDRKQAIEVSNMRRG